MIEIAAILKKLSVASLLLGLIVSCNDQKPTQSDPFTSTLTKTKIGESNYYISLPKNYTIEEKEGPDFSVFYFSTTDSVAKNAFSGGLYFGNFPNFFEPQNDSCQVNELESQIMGTLEIWRTYNCTDRYSIQTIVDSKGEEGWNNKIHAFGTASTKEDVDRILLVFATFVREEEH